jgi:glycosyltransferase involved in cell wall biosynthesis
MTFTLFVPVLNEVEGMRDILPTVPKGLFSQILIVDGGSTDGSVEWARENNYELYVQKQPGIRPGYIEAWPLIRGEYVVTFSPDGNCKTEDLPPLVAKLREGYEMVVASRYLGGTKSEDDNWLTGFGNWMFTRTINLVHGGHYTDAMTIYRGYRTALFYELDMHKPESYVTDDWMGTISGLEPLLSIRAARAGVRIGEISSIEPARISGVSKMRAFRWGASFLLQIARETRRPRG